MSRKTLYGNDAVVFVDGTRGVDFKTTEVEKDVVATGISQAEAYVEKNANDFTGKKVEIYVKHKAYSFEEVKSVVMKEV